MRRETATAAVRGKNIHRSGFASESVADKTIKAGHVPEPSTWASLGILALGAAGLRRFRERSIDKKR